LVERIWDADLDLSLEDDKKFITVLSLLENGVPWLHFQILQILTDMSHFVISHGLPLSEKLPLS